MIGSLTVDKASVNFSYFLKSIKIVADNGGRISREEFVQNMADFMGSSSTDVNGDELRTPYNKSKLCRYFGFLYIEDENILCLTRRGEFLTRQISEDLSTDDPQKRYYLKDNTLLIVRWLFILDILYNSYGRNNCGAERSNTDTEPPKVIVKLLANIGKASKDEICYAIYALNGGKKGNVSQIKDWDDIIDTIKQYRLKGREYTDIFEAWGIKNIRSDFKVLDLLAHPNVNIVNKDDNDKMYYLSPDIDQQYISLFKVIPHYYKPLYHFINTENGSFEDSKNWVLNALINRNEGDFDFRVCDVRDNANNIQDDINALVKLANANKKHNTFILVISYDKEQAVNSFGTYKELIDRVDDFKHERNGFSLNSVIKMPIKEFPANFHIVFLKG